MKIQLFDGYDLQSLELDQDVSITWVPVPFVQKRIEIKYISQDLYNFLDIPDWMDRTSDKAISLEKGVTFFLMLSDGNHTVLVRSSGGLYYERDNALSERLTRMLTEAIASGNTYSIIDLNAKCSADEQFELIPQKQTKDILTIVESYRDTAFA